MEEIQQDLLTDFVGHPHLIQAGTGKRLVNFLIDYAVYLGLMAVIGFVLALVSPEAIDSVGSNTGFDLVDKVIALLIYGVYMSLIEAITKGRSLGKLITGTKAVNEDGSTITAGTAFKRGFSRMVPFEVLSALGSPSYPWHDKWNHTYVIDIKESFVMPETSQSF